MTVATSISTLEELQTLFRSFGVDAIYLKALAPKQDNDKNQIYFGGGMGALTNIFPGSVAFRSESQSTRKRGSKAGQPKIELNLQFSWVTRSGELSKAPTAKIIDYFQYPEVRFSGFLKGSRDAPRALRRKYQAEFGQRVLALGVAPNREVVGLLLTESQDPLVRSLPELPSLPAAPILKVLLVDGAAGQTPGEKLISEVRQIVSGGWHKSVQLKPGDASPVPFPSSQGGGYTLEALLGIPSNAAGEPDKYGFEVKGFGGKSSRISLMTPTGDLGLRGTTNFETFITRYGHPAKNGDGRRRFTGTHRVGQTCGTSGLRMELTGYDPATQQITGEVKLLLIDANGDIATGWSIDKLGDHWNLKHASAIYVSHTRRNLEAGSPHKYEYKYGPKAVLGEGTSIHRLLRGLSSGIICYDPGDEIEASGAPLKRKERPQFRISRASLQEAMGVLYEKVTVVDLTCP